MNLSEFTLRDASLETLWAKVKELKERRKDLVVPPSYLKMENGRLQVRNVRDLADQALADAGLGGITGSDYDLSLNDHARGQLSEKLGINKRYQDRMLDRYPDLYDINVNEWLKWENDQSNTRNFLVRSYLDNDGRGGLGRAVLSDTYRPTDNFEFLATVMKAIMDLQKDGGPEIRVASCSLTETRMYVRFQCPGIETNARDILDRYADPETGRMSKGVTSGFVISNSEVGAGSTVIAPRIIVGACTNGMIWTEEQFRKVHLGKKLETGLISWSADTVAANNALAINQMQDAIATYCSADFLGKLIEDLEEKGSYQLQHPHEVVLGSCKELGLTEAAADSIMNAFMRQGSTRTAFDVVQAVTWYAKNIDGDNRFDLERHSVSLLDKIPTIDNRAAAKVLEVQTN